MTTDEKVTFLKSYGWVIGDRDPGLNTNYDGQYMCAEPYEQDELPTEDGSNGPWCIVGNDLNLLIDEAYDFLTTLYS